MKSKATRSVSNLLTFLSMKRFCRIKILCLLITISTTTIIFFHLHYQTTNVYVNNINIIYENKSRIISKTNTYLWKFGIAMLCDKHSSIKTTMHNTWFTTIENISNFNNIKNGHLVWIKEFQINDFVEYILPNITKYFSLITATNAAWIFPLYYLNHTNYRHKYISNVQKLLSNKYLLYWFTENFDGFQYYSVQMEGIPIGIDFHSNLVSHNVSLKQSYNVINTLLSNKTLIKSVNKRVLKIYADISLNVPKFFQITLGAKKGNEKYNNLNTWYRRQFYNHSIIYLYENFVGDEVISQIRFLYRSGIYWLITNQIKDWKNLFVFSDKKMAQNETFIERSKYVFLLSPIGNGLDCHRTWEALLFGHIVIVQSSPLDSLYIKHDLPVVIVDDYTNINQSMLEIWYELYKDKTSLNSYETRYKLTNEYWINYMKRKTRELLKHK
eukprot:505758_1